MALYILILIGLLIHLAPVTYASKNVKEKVAETAISPEQMTIALENLIESERAELSNLKGQLKTLEAEHDALLTKINTYNFQNTAQSQLLLSARVRTEDLEYAIENNRFEYRTLGELMKRFKKEWGPTTILYKKTDDRIKMAQEEIADVQQSQLPNTQKRHLQFTTQKVIDALKEKKQVGERFQKTYEDLLGQMDSALEAKKKLGEKLTTQLESQKKAGFFRRSGPYHAFRGETLQKEILFFWSRIKSVFSPVAWKVKWEQVKMGRFDLWVVFLMVLILAFILQSRCRIILKRMEERCEDPDCRHRHLALFLVRRSLPYLSIALLFWIFSFLHYSPLNIGLGRLLFSIFILLLVTRWGLDYLEHGLRDPSTGVRSFVTWHLKSFFRFYRASYSVVILIIWIGGSGSHLAQIARGILAIIVLLWAVVFWRRIKPVVIKGRLYGQTSPNSKRMALLQGWTYLVIGGSFLLNFGGYRILANQWFRSWTETVVLLFLGLISYNVIQELYRKNRDRIARKGDEQPSSSTQQIRRSLIQFTWVVWISGLTFGILRSWDPSGILRLGFLHFFDLVFTIGSIKLSIINIVISIVIIFVTHMAVRIGRLLIKEKILEKRTFDQGFKESIITITSYVGWIFGLLLALAVIGVNATSLALVFGALSVGIGFGLQNIFNNFISGLILLFERPIQVGDYVEVNGLWAEVKKINVRATVVQTFDNASVIIPNSEFISKQVTNWSFQDKRMRRNLEIGVAYGSDIDLVQRTLLEIVESTKKVLKHPRPDVLFIDHADSSLIFRLRIWVHVDNYWIVPSKMRGDIDRRFRELGIEIAFPQQDLHIRTILKGKTLTGPIGIS